ncbi:MAG: hypothetical protein IKR34_02245 [Candidatus Gastranaerophilales bacterium]|nr:hypothetical protein [Elusimicrobiota bacterium]MBR6298044.1 hypothetical protein [Candidatus Gastranaerophilales bacterium]
MTQQISDIQDTQDTQQQQSNLGGDISDIQDTQQQPDQQQPPEGQQPDQKQEPEQKKQEGQEENDLFGKPETYDYKDVKLPENMKLDEDMKGKFNEYAAKLNLSQKGANDLVKMAVELTKTTQQRTVDSLGKLQEAQIEKYKQQLNSDSEIGGANLKESIATANLAYDEFFADEEMRSMIAQVGLNVHPKFVKALKAIGSQMKEDKIHSSGNPAMDKRNREDILYPSMEQ